MRVLIYEGINYHSECLSSYYAYFKELGYEVDVVMGENRYKEKPFWMLKDITIYTLSNLASSSLDKHTKEIKEKIPNLFKYDIYFISTLISSTYGFIKFLLKNGIKRNQILFQSHRNYKTFLAFTKNDNSLANNGFTLGLSNEKFPQLSPIKNCTSLEHTYLNKNLNELNLFIGGLSHIHFKNFEALVKAAEKLTKMGKPIKIKVTGIREQRDYILPESDCVEYLGRLDFEEMAKQYVFNDYCFVLFDENAFSCIADHKVFLRGRISGSRNMSIMYKIPLVVQKAYQKSWGLDDTNSISYDGHDYINILSDLFKITKEQYNTIIQNLQLKEKIEFTHCLKNLSTKLDFIKTLPDLKINKKDSSSKLRKKDRYITF